MSKYTVELRKIIANTSREEVESWFKDYNLEDYLTDEEITVITQRGTWSKDRLAKKIVDHYFMREIGLETVGLFKHKAKVAMQEIMEEKLPLIYSAAIRYDPLVNVDFREEYTSEGEANSTSNNSGEGLTINSDTPQNRISLETIKNGEYASSTSGTETSNQITDESTSGQHYVRTQKGNSGSITTAQRLIDDYRKNIIMIDRDIIEDLSSLFMGIY